MGRLLYNTIELPYPLTTQFSQESGYDPASGTDRIITKFDIIVEGILNANHAATLAPSITWPEGYDAAGMMSIVRTKLLQPRKLLQYIVNGTNVIPRVMQGNLGTVDVANGPQPQYCNIMQLTAETFLFSYHITAKYWENYNLQNITKLPPENLFSASVLSNRWTEAVDIDECDYTTRTREGSYTIRSDNPLGWIADQFRSYDAVLSVPYGFLRTGRSYTQSADGLTLAYRVTDREQHKMPPGGAFTADGYYYETTTANGQIRHSECQVKLKGSKRSPETELIDDAVLIAARTIRFRGAQLQGRTTEGGPVLAKLTRASVRRSLYGNEVEVVIGGMYKATKGRFRGVQGFVGMDTRTPLSELPGSDRNIPDYLDRGSAELIVQAAAYQDAGETAGKVLGVGPIRTSSNPQTTHERTKVQMERGFLPGQAGKDDEG